MVPGQWSKILGAATQDIEIGKHNPYINHTLAHRVQYLTHIWIQYVFPNGYVCFLTTSFVWCDFSVHKLLTSSLWATAVWGKYILGFMDTQTTLLLEIIITVKCKDSCILRCQSNSLWLYGDSILRSITFGGGEHYLWKRRPIPNIR